MDYGTRRLETMPPPSHHAAPHLYDAPPQHHHLNLIQREQPPHPPPSSSSSSSYLPSYSYYQDPNSNNPQLTLVRNHHNPVPAAGNVHTPAVATAADPYLSIPYAPRGGYDGRLAPASYSYPSVAPPPPPPGVAAARTGIGLAHYYGVGPHGFAAKEAIRQYGVDALGSGAAPPRAPNGLDPTIPPHLLPVQWPTKSMHPNSKSGSKKGSKRNIRVVRSAFCEVCKVDCNSQDVLNTHKQGKKHKKNLQKLQRSITPKPPLPPTTPVEKKKEAVPVADKEKAKGEQSKRKGARAGEEDLETKKRKVMEGGASANEVKVCTICNVVVNSQKVFDYHIAGQRHTAMVKKQKEAVAS